MGGVIARLAETPLSAFLPPLSRAAFCLRLDWLFQHRYRQGEDPERVASSAWQPGTHREGWLP